MKIGKIPESVLKRSVFKQIRTKRPEVLVGAGVGEDCAVMKLAEDEVFVLSTDPITGTAKDMGELAVHVTANDLASAGAEPVGMLLTVLLRESVEEADIRNMMEEVENACHQLNIQVMGGHTEVTRAVNQPLISVTGVGKAKADRIITTSGARPGQDVVITKWIGIEGTSIIAKEKEEELKVTKNIVHLDENKCEDEIEKRGIINILKKFFKKKSKYKTEDELEALKEFDYLDENENSMVVAEESNVYRQDAEEGTTILSLICPLKPIRLTAIGTEIPINIVPNHYPYLIGKSRASCDFCIDSSVISRVHLRVSEEIDGYTIEDLNSTNGTFLNGEKLKEHEVQAIKEGDRISLANLEFVVE